MTETGLPLITEDAALSDRAWFSRWPYRRFHARAGDGGWWIVRRSGDALLRTHSTLIVPVSGESDRPLARAWYMSAQRALRKRG